MKQIFTFFLMSFFLMTGAFAQDLLNEDFEDVTPPDLPMGWTGIIDANGGDMLYTYDDGSNTMAVFFRQSPSTEIPFIMVSPMVDLANAGELNFDVMFGANFIEDLVLSVGTISDPLNGDTYTEITQFTIQSTWTSWENLTVDFSNYSGTDQYVAFKFLGEDTGVFFYMDNIVLAEQVPPPSYLIDEDFEDVTPPDLPMGWTGIIDANGGDMLYTYDDGSNTMAVFFRQSPSTEIPFIMVSPMVDLANAGELNFDVMFGANFIEDLVLSVGTISDPLNGDTYTEITQFTIQSTWTSWETLNVDFSNYSGTDQYLAFKFLGEDTGVFFYMDNILLTGEVVTLDPPTALVAEPVADDIVLNWQAPGGNPSVVILCVDRDGSNPASGLDFTDDWQYIEPAMIANGFNYDYYEVEDVNSQDGPDLATMQQYDLIIWFTGECWNSSQTMTDNDEANLAAYLDGGGALLLSAHDYLWDRYPTAGNFSAGQFPYDYLGVASTTQDAWSIQAPATASITGDPGSFAEGLSFTVQDIYTTTKEGLYIDELYPLDQELLQVTDPAPVGGAACQYDGGAFRTAFTTASIAAIVEPDALTQLLGNAVNWLLPSGGRALLGYNVYYKLDNGNYEPIANVEETTFTHVDAATVSGVHSYYVTAVYDEGESVGSNEVTVSTVGLRENAAVNLQVYPNPATDAVNVESAVQIRGIGIFAYDGRCIKTQTIDNGTCRINTSGFAPGIYFLQIETEQGNVVKRLIVQ